MNSLPDLTRHNESLSSLEGKLKTHFFNQIIIRSVYVLAILTILSQCNLIQFFIRTIHFTEKLKKIT